MAARVSVIMPCYNCEKLVDETLTCLKEQTYKDFEVICVNDGSKDGTLDVLKAWQEKNALNMRVIDQPNGGVSSVRNRGIDLAEGELIVFLDSDDIYHCEFIERLVNAIDGSSFDVAYCKLTKSRENVISCTAPETDYIKQAQADAMNNLLYRMGEFGFSCYIYKKSVIEEIQLRFDLNTAFGEDREFNWKYLCHCENAAFVDMPLYWYRTNTESVTVSKASWKKTDLLAAIKRTEAYLSENNCSYSAEFNSYMYARAMWAVAKTFAVSRDKELFKRLIKEYDVKPCMKRTSKDKSKLVAIASILYLVNPMLFFFAIGLKA